MRQKLPTANGRPVDASGWPARDPTENVKNDLAAAVRRMDDLARAAARRDDDLRRSHEELSRVRATATEKLAQVREKAALERERARGRLAKAESKRLNAVRKVDVAAGAVATATAERTAQLLATQLATTADTLRKQVETTAAAQEVKLQTLLIPIGTDIRELRESRSTIAGKDSAAFDPLLKEMQALRDDGIKLAAQQLAATQALAVANQNAARGTQGRQFNLTSALALVAILIALIVAIVVVMSALAGKGVPAG